MSTPQDHAREHLHDLLALGEVMQELKALEAQRDALIEAGNALKRTLQCTGPHRVVISPTLIAAWDAAVLGRRPQLPVDADSTLP